MRKLLFAALLLLCLSVSYGQETQFRRIYTELAITQNGKTTHSQGENVIFFNYGGEAVIKIYLADGSVRTFDQTTDRDEGRTNGGMGYSGATYKERDKDLTIYVQLFKNQNYGFRILFSNGDMIQFL
jgi:hypothetical protein